MSHSRLTRAMMVVAMVAAGAGADNGGRMRWGAGWLSNPALLADTATERWEVCVVQGDIAVRNNAFNLDLYRRYNGAFLEEDDKQTILESISGQSVRGLLRGEGSAMGVRIGHAAFTIGAYLGGDLSVDKEMIDLVFFGNDLDRRYEVLNSGGALAYLSAGAAYGLETGDMAGWTTSVGIGGRVAVGLVAAKIMESSLSVLTEVGGVTATGATVVRRTDADGARPVTVALDLGGRATKGKWELGLSFTDIGPSFSWSEVEEKLVEFEAIEWTAELGDSGYTTADTTYDVGSWSTPLPTRMEVTVGRSLPWGAVWMRWEQGLRRWAGVTTTPRVHTGVAWDALSWLRPWFELGLGSPEGFGMALGTALTPGPVRLSLGITGFRLPPSHSEALGLRLGLGFGG